MLTKLRLPAAALAVITTTALLGSTPAAAVELKLASFVGGRHVMNRAVFAPWAKEIGEKSGGKLTVTMHVGGSLGKGPAKQFKRAVDGVADITWGLQGYTSKLFRRTTLIELASISTDGIDATSRLWSIYDKYLAPEYKRVKVLAIWALDIPILHTRSKRVTKISDLAGLKIRTPSRFSAKLIAALGATPVAMPVTKLYNALDRGVVDGVLISPSAVNSFKLGEVTKYHITGIPFGVSPFFAVMNARSYANLSPANKALINETTGRGLSIKAAEAYEADSHKGYQTIRNAKGHEVIALPRAEVDKAVALLDQAERQIVADLDKQGIPAAKIVAALRKAGG